MEKMASANMHYLLLLTHPSPTSFLNCAAANIFEHGLDDTKLVENP